MDSLGFEPRVRRSSLRSAATHRDSNPRVRCTAAQLVNFFTAFRNGLAGIRTQGLFLAKEAIYR